MADNNPPRLPGNFLPGKKYLVSGDTLLAWRRDLMADRAIAGPGITESQTPQGRIFQVQTGNGAFGNGAFYQLYDAAADTYLLGGTVTGGHGGTVAIADILVLDAVDGPGANAGKVLYIRANATATTEDGIMLTGLLLNSAETHIATTGSPPDNHTFTVSAPTGNLHIEIGRWTADRFFPSAPGHIEAAGCPGNFFLRRA
jgi:hypothetical protein